MVVYEILLEVEVHVILKDIAELQILTMANFNEFVWKWILQPFNLTNDQGLQKKILQLVILIIYMTNVRLKHVKSTISVTYTFNKRQ